MTVVGILGTIHTDELRERFDFSLELLNKIIVSFNPDIICGEVRDQDWKNYINNRSEHSGYLGPSEYRKCIIPLCNINGISFQPIDWFDESITKLDHFEHYAEQKQKELENQLLLYYEKIFMKNKECVIPLNGLEVDALIKEKQDWLYEINPVYQNLSWIRRNEKMVTKLKAVIKSNPTKRILCTIGIEHSYYFYEVLSEMKDIKICYPLDSLV